MSDDFEQRSSTFLGWLQQKGAYISEKIVLRDLRSDGAGRGVVAASDISEDEVLFNIPRSTVLSTANSELPEKCPSAFTKLDPWNSLILVMMYENALDSTSTWHPYFEILPRSFDTLMYWSDDELVQLQGSAVRKKIGKNGANKSFLEDLMPSLKQAIECFPPETHSHLLSESSFLEVAHRMGTLIMAYAFDIESEVEPKEVDEEGYASDDDDDALPKGMVPLADMLNADADRNNSRLFYEPNSLTMKPLRPLTAGEEIFNDYGPLPRSDLLRRYGYLTSNYAKFDVTEISQELIIDAVRAEYPDTKNSMKERLTYLEDECVLEEGYDISRGIGADEEDAAYLPGCFSPELLGLLATLLAPQAEFERCRQKHKIPKVGELTVDMAKVLLRAIEKKTAEYTTSLKDDESALAAIHAQRTGPKKSRLEMAVEVRMGEKWILTQMRDGLVEYIERSEQHPNKKRKAA